VADLADALTRVVGDPATARAMGHAGRQRAEDHFAWNAIAARTRELYERVLAG
jgi:starch synthase